MQFIRSFLALAVVSLVNAAPIASTDVVTFREPHAIAANFDNLLNEAVIPAAPATHIASTDAAFRENAIAKDLNEAAQVSFLREARTIRPGVADLLTGELRHKDARRAAPKVIFQPGYVTGRYEDTNAVASDSSVLMRRAIHDNLVDETITGHQR